MRNTIPFQTASANTNIPMRVFTKLRKLGGIPGINLNSTVNIKKFMVWYNDNKDSHPALSNEETTLEDLKFQETQVDIRLKLLKEKSMERELIEPGEVKALLVELAINQSVVLKKIFSELPIKCAGKSEQDIRAITDHALEDIFNVLQDKANKIK